MNNEEITRYEQFCQFKTEIRGSDQYLIVGIDVAKDKHHAFFGTANGKTLLKRLLFENNQAGFVKLIERADQLVTQHGLSKVVYGLEPTGNYHKPLSQWLLDKEQRLVLVSNVSIRDNRQTLDGRWDKNDTKDSANVADLISQGKCQFFEKPTPDLVELRTLLSIRKRLKKEEHRLRMQIRNGLVAKHFPELDRYWGSSIKESMAIVRYLLDPRLITALSFKDFFLKVTTKERGLKQKRRLKAIYDVAAVSVGCPMGSAARLEAGILVKQLEQKQEQIDKLMREIHKAANKFSSYHLLTTIPGFGPFISALVVATIGNPSRFKSRKQVIRLAGLDLNAKRSGKRSKNAVPVISKRGNAELRYGLYHASLIGSYYDDDLRALFVRYHSGREKEHGIKTKMRVKLAAKMLVIAWTMMKNKTPFDGSMIGS